MLKLFARLFGSRRKPTKVDFVPHAGVSDAEFELSEYTTHEAAYAAFIKAVEIHAPTGRYDHILAAAIRFEKVRNELSTKRRLRDSMKVEIPPTSNYPLLPSPKVS